MSTKARVLIPGSVRKTIQSIKEITGNPCEEEIYGMLKDCSMDPNETAQKLLLQDTFHEVKSKRDKRKDAKENLNNKESAGLRWRPGMQGRGSRAVHGNYLPQDISCGTGGGRNSALGKENGFTQNSDKGVGILSSPTSQDTKNKETTPATSSVTVMTNGTIDITSENTGAACTAHLFSSGPVNHSEEVSTVGISKLRASSSPLHPVGAKENPKMDFGTGDTLGQLTPNSNNMFASMTMASNSNLAQGFGTAGSSEVPIAVEASGPELSGLDSMEAASKLQTRKVDEFSDVQHVIIPNHILVPEVEKLGFCFGSFDASVGFSTSYSNDKERDKSITPLSEISAGIEETVEQSSSNQSALATAEEGDSTKHPQSPTRVPENLSSNKGDVLSTAVPEYTESKQETTLLPASKQCSTIHTASNYSSGFMPQMLSSQLAPFESSDSQSRDVSSFVVPQPLDPASYYAPFYRFGADSDGLVSPLHPPGVGTKYNGNVTVSPQTYQPPQEGGNSMVLSTAGPTPLVTQTAVVMQNSIALTQPPIPVFHLPTGVHMPHYPQNFIPYGHYISPPFYIPPPAVHQILSNAPSPQEPPQAGSVYPAPPAATAKFSVTQYKPGTSAGNATYIGLPGGHGTDGSSPAGYSPSLAVTNGNSAIDEALASSQFKESNVYVTAQQTEGSAVWITPPGRDISGLQASTFYNIHPGQVTFNPMQAGHGTFPVFYQPAQVIAPANMNPLLQQFQTIAGTFDMVGPTVGVYQQLQPSPTSC